MKLFQKLKECATEDVNRLDSINTTLIFVIFLSLMMVLFMMKSGISAMVISDNDTCGDAICGYSESCTTCSIDCGPCIYYCGDGLCNVGETCLSCEADCGVCKEVERELDIEYQPPAPTPVPIAAPDIRGKQEYAYEVIFPGEKTLIVDDSRIPVSKITMNIGSLQRLPKIEVWSLKKQDEAPKMKDQVVYRYLEITKENISDSALQKVVINFEVPLEWLKSNQVDTKDIRLYRHTNRRWNELKTEYTGYINGEATYEAMSPGFSFFAIAELPSRREVNEEGIPVDLAQRRVAAEKAQSEWSPEKLVQMRRLILPMSLSLFLMFAGITIFVWLNKRNNVYNY